MLKFILTGFFWGVVIMLAVPSTLILASWNAIPGDSTYNLKVGLEKVILGVAPSPNLKSTLEIKYTERRFDEVEKVLSTNNNYINESLTNFNNQLVVSQNSIKQIASAEQKSVQTQNLINTLETVSQKIEQEEQILKPSPTNTPFISKVETVAPQKIVTVIPTKIPPTPISTDVPANPPSNSDIPEKLKKTKEKVKKAIEELKQSQDQEDHNNNSGSNNSEPNKSNKSEPNNPTKRNRN